MTTSRVRISVLQVGQRRVVQWLEVMVTTLSVSVHQMNMVDTLDCYLYVTSTCNDTLCKHFLFQDLTPGEPPVSALALDIISYIGLTLSSICLVIVIITYSTSKYDSCPIPSLVTTHLILTEPCVRRNMP